MAETYNLTPDFAISRMIKGGWQLSRGHSEVNTEDPIEGMFAFTDQGITTFDCADIYTGVEELIGKFLLERKRRLGHHNDVKVLTKFVPDYDALTTINKHYVERIIDRSLHRLNLERLDMVQFSWWSYDIPRYVETAFWLKELQQAGKINLISGTNFNTLAVENMVSAGIPLTTLQVQYSLLDNRPEKSLVDICSRHGIHLLCYGTVAGGFLSERWLGTPEPMAPFENRSLVKYKLMIDELGGWELFQLLLRKLKHIADKHKATITNVASRYVLDRKQVAGIIIGAKSTSHLAENLKVFDIDLDREDFSSIAGVLSQGRELKGDVFDLERIKDGPHGRIMKYNLNETL